MKLSILVPAYNEAATTLAEALKRLLEVELPCEKEIIVIDDGSNDAIDDGSNDATSEVAEHLWDKRCYGAKPRY